MAWPFKGKKRRKQVFMAKYDGAQTTANDRKHWVNADQLSADAAANPSVRQILRNRARYEVANGCYAQGIVLTLANDVIGTGPHLQMLTDMETANAVIETEFAAWSSKIRLAEKLRTMRIAKAQDGEAFALLFSNDNLDSPVKLDVRLIEADQIATPMPPLASATDGIEFDTFGNPSAYHVMKSHPGDMIGGVSFAYDRVPASSMLHWFRADRPGQSRGVSEMTPAINMFGQLRQYRQATLDAARAAANLSLAIKTTMPSGGEARDVDSMTEMEMVPNMAVFLPEGWEPYQIKAEQPTTTYTEYYHASIAEAARQWSMPKNVALGDSSGYNYASGRLDHQTYFKAIRVEQSQCEQVVLDRILAAWLAEAVKVLGLDVLGDDITHQWIWDGHEHVDPAKEANAQTQKLASNTTTLAAEYARQGKDWEKELRQRAREVALAKELGLTAPPPAAPEPSNPDEQPKPNDEEEGDASTDEE